MSLDSLGLRRVVRQFALGTLPLSALLAPALSVASPTSPPTVVLLAPPRAAPTPADVRAAAKRFGEGERAFRVGDFTHAASAFEAAYELAPHEDALWNAAKAWRHAGELARAANLYARYLREAPVAARDRNAATASLVELSGSLGRIDVHAPSFDVILVDETTLDGLTTYVAPGSHVVRARRADRQREQVVAAAAGQVVSVAFTSETPEARPPASLPPVDGAVAPATPRVAEAPPPPAAAIADERTHGWSPWVVAVEGTLTTFALAFTIASAVDTRHARNAFVAAPTAQGLDDGRAKEARTNVLVGVTVGLAALTAASAIWLVDWRSRHGGARVGVSGGAGAAGIEPRALVAGTFD